LSYLSSDFMRINNLAAWLHYEAESMCRAR